MPPPKIYDQIFQRIQNALYLVPVFSDDVAAQYGSYWSGSTNIATFIEVVRPFCYIANIISVEKIWEWLIQNQIVFCLPLSDTAHINVEHPYITHCFPSSPYETFEESVTRNTLAYLICQIEDHTTSIPKTDLEMEVERLAQWKVYLDPIEIVRYMEQARVIHVDDDRVLYYSSSTASRTYSKRKGESVQEKDFESAQLQNRSKRFAQSECNEQMYE